MRHIRPAQKRGRFDHGWLQTAHTFSFADYHDPRYQGFRALRVINEDHVQPGAGFPMHPHRDMEIVTVVLSGQLEHRDSMGNGAVLRPGELQRITAGTGIWHSEFNPSAESPVHLYQIWMLPRQRGLEPGWEQHAFAPQEKLGRWRLVASPDGQDGSLTVQQDVRLSLSELAPAQRLKYELSPGRHAWLQVLRGQVEVGGDLLSPGDGLSVSEEPGLELKAREQAEVLLFDLQ